MGDDRYHIVINNEELEVKPVVSYRNLVSQPSFLNEEDYRKIINEYRDEILSYGSSLNEN